jgi:tRNA-splicing ligase RtcB
MRVPGIFYATPETAELAMSELNNWLRNRNSALASIVQIAYVATLPGIATASFGMPDMHSGYGFSIGGVAAFDTSDPDCIISPGGVGYDINCGVRCLTTPLRRSDVKPHLKSLVDALYQKIPVGVGGKRHNFMTKQDIGEIVRDGAKWAIKRGYGVQADLDNCEENGCLRGAALSAISDRAVQRGVGQLGTLGAGNHYVEIQEVAEIFDQRAASVMGLSRGQIVVMIHTGSRGLGYQVADDFIKEMEEKCDIDTLPDRQLSAAPVASELGKRYLKAMAAAANYAWCNRQVISHFAREAFREVFETDDLEMNLIYDVAHNIAKIEKHVVDGVEREFVVHRKGATRAFGPGHPEIPRKYRGIGQPVLIGGSMGTASYILVGTDRKTNRAFGSTCHGAGRVLSRSKAIRDLTADEVQGELSRKGIRMKAANKQTIVEEAPESYKDVDEVVEACQAVGISRKVARLVPLGVIKG